VRFPIVVDRLDASFNVRALQGLEWSKRRADETAVELGTDKREVVANLRACEQAPRDEYLFANGGPDPGPRRSRSAAHRAARSGSATTTPPSPVLPDRPRPRRRRPRHRHDELLSCGTDPCGPVLDFSNVDPSPTPRSTVSTLGKQLAPLLARIHRLVTSFASGDAW